MCKLPWTQMIIKERTDLKDSQFNLVIIGNISFQEQNGWRKELGGLG